MSIEGLGMMLITEGLVTIITFYFFFRILFSKKSKDNKSELENDQ